MYFYNVTQRRTQHQKQRAFKRCLPCSYTKSTKTDAIVLRNAEIRETCFQQCTEHEKDMIKFKYSEYSSVAQTTLFFD